MNALALLLVGLAPWTAPQDDPVKALKSKDVGERLAAIEALAAGGHEGASKALANALDDPDWEVIARAAAALAKVGDEEAVEDLVQLALEGPCARLRRAGAQALAAIAAAPAAGELAKKAGGKSARTACEALALVAGPAGGAELPRGVQKLVEDEEVDARTRAAAAAALVASAGERRVEVLAELFESPYIVAQAAALEAAQADPRAEQVDELAKLLGRDALAGALERRAGRALAASLAMVEEGASDRAATIVATLSADSRAAVAARAPRLVPLLTSLPGYDAARLEEALLDASEHADEGVRAQAAAARGHLGAAGIASARRIGAGDSSARVRRAALAALVALEPGSEETGTFLVERLKAEADANVREDLCVALGTSAHAQHGAALVAALDDAEWGVSACAAVSLGLARPEGALAPLKTLSTHADWRRRGAALVGIHRLRDVQGVPILIEALADAEPSIVRTVHAALVSLSGNAPLAAEVEPWRDWWRKNETTLRLSDPQELEERRKKYGYAVPASEIYRGLDVCVLESRGDHIEVLLDVLAIDHRLTAGARIPQDGLDPAGVFVSNCTGEIEAPDVERLAWFARCGGYLFGSCWALHETIERVTPGTVRKLDTPGEVLDMVLASQCAPESPYSKGVFGDGVQPIYTLEGAHLIELVAPERVEVLIDSAECAERWGGGGELACWFRLGHGVILDSVNHFDLQGLERAEGLKKPEERMAYAVDHMGLGWEELRATRDEPWWKNAHKAAQEIRDFSVFELVTNFVRLRRIEGR